ncbi:helix-turn-helix domain-containing protein [Streptomyces sp. N35]|uniref:helix-turn-helix domain-containing protein n=1 Tax=Streptomyces sp. N35 TaxID=2795730 RepID=UPI001F2BD421|nr:helix-turn-helix transcriptional regulator [Streptomyces sp. N35]
MPIWVHTRRRAIGEHIRTARLHANLSQAALGELVGRDHKTIHRYERGDSDPRLSDLLLIADALEVPVAELLAE